MKVDIELVSGPNFQQAHLTGTEPTEKVDGTALNDLTFIEPWFSIDGVETKPFTIEATQPEGGGNIDTYFPVPVNIGDKKDVSFWATAINVRGQESDKSEVIVKTIDRTAINPEKAPSPPTNIKVTIDPNIAAPDFEIGMEVTEPTTKKDGTPLDNLTFLTFWHSVDGEAVGSLRLQASGPTGGKVQAFWAGSVTVPDGEIKEVLFWAVAENSDSQTSEKSEIITQTIDRRPLDPGMAPKPPK